MHTNHEANEIAREQGKTKQKHYVTKHNTNEYGGGGFKEEMKQHRVRCHALLSPAWPPLLYSTAGD